MKAMAYIFMVLTALFTVQPLVMMGIQSAAVSASEDSCATRCGQTEPEQKNENKSCDTTTRCNTGSCCFTCQYLPAEDPLYKTHWLASNVKLNPHYTEKPVSGYSTDCWQPPELFFI